MTRSSTAAARALGRSAHGLLAAALLTATCTPAAPPPAKTGDDERFPTPAYALPHADAPDAAAQNPDAAAPVASTPAAPPLASTPARFRCGISSCRVADETCCLAGSEGVCLTSSPDDAPHGEIGYLKTQFEACHAAPLPHGYSLSGIERCDESIDCPSGQLCCDEFLFSGGTISECIAPLRSGETPCDYGERCIESSTCRLPGTACIEGTCRKPTPALRCGSDVCTEGEVCCGQSASCRPESACQGPHRVRCNSERDCIPGQQCLVMGYGTDCVALLQDPYSQRLVCKRDADCKNPCPTTPGAPAQRARCKPTDLPWLKSCECPDPR